MKTDITISAEQRVALEQLVADRNTPAKVVWRDRSGERRRRKRQGGRAGDGQVEAVRVALAAALCRGRRRGPHARQDAAAGQDADASRVEGQGAGQDRARDAARCDALERALAALEAVAGNQATESEH